MQQSLHDWILPRLPILVGLGILVLWNVAMLPKTLRDYRAAKEAENRRTRGFPVTSKPAAAADPQRTPPTRERA